ncbi:uncharacterized protein LOC121330072 [Polyodon spathula]|uniref:uncharacterized protein LOC121330072 n=1 Tax=Polyodon spathula TaxID=7913 RepID=UPI001B7EC36F|nr:uncharacterized protein LOC121330072 [Polyodon spathula]
MAEKKRNPNWTEAEKVILLQEYAKRKYILTSRFNPGVTSALKQKHWEEITESVNTRNTSVKRTLQEVKKKYENVSSAAKKEYREFKRRSRKRARPGPSQTAAQSTATSISDSLGLSPRIIAVSTYTLPPGPNKGPIQQSPQVWPGPQLPSLGSHSPLDLQNTHKVKEFGNLHEELDGIRTAITNCGNRIESALDPIASSLRELTQHLGSLVGVMAGQPSRTFSHAACQTIEQDLGEQQLVESKVEESSPPCTDSALCQTSR